MNIKLIDEKVLCKGKRITLFSRKYMVDEKIVVRDVVHFGESVAILPLLDNDEVILINQFRAPLGRWILEAPAGIIEEGETYLEAARRELEEEAGYRAGKIKKMSSVHLSPGYSDELIHIVYAEDLEYVGAHPEPTEFIKVVKMNIDEAVANILKSDVADGKTLLALMLYKKMKL